MEINFSKLVLVIALALAGPGLSGCTTGCPPSCLGERLGAVDWSGKDLGSAKLVNSSARQSNMSGVNFNGSDLSGIDLAGSNLKSADFSQAKLIGANLENTYLSGAIFNGTDLTGASLISADLTGAVLTSSRLTSVKFDRSRLINADLSQLDLAGSYMIEATMTGCKLNRANLAGSLLDKADLSGADMRYTDLHGAWINLGMLVGATLHDADLSGASLIGADLTGANLNRASLAGANLVGAVLRGVDLRGADLRDAELIATAELLDRKNLDDDELTRLSEAQWNKLALGNAILDGARYDNQTLWPEGFTPPSSMIYQSEDDENSMTYALEPGHVAERRLTISGTQTVANLVIPLTRAFMARNPDFYFDFVISDSAAGIAEVSNGKADIGMSLRDLNVDEQRLPGSLKVLPLAYQGIIVVANLQNPIEQLTLDQLQAIFTGEINNWQELGGPDLPITVIQQDSEMVDYFQTEVIKTGPADAIQTISVPNDTGVRADVAALKGAIGLLPQILRDRSIKALAINGIQPTVQYISAQEYPLIQPLLLVIPAQPSDEIQLWLDFMSSDECDQKIVLEGMEPVKHEP